MPPIVCVLLSLAAMPMAGCKSDGKPDGDAEVLAAGAAAAPVVGPALKLDPEVEQSLYVMMIGVEVGAGASVPKDQLHTARGLIECRKDGVTEPCGVRVRIASDDLSQSQPIPEATTEKVWEFIRGSRPDLAEAKVALASLDCDYIGKKSPPYNIEDVHCSVLMPRAVAEAVFDGGIAEELAELTRGITAFGDKGLVTVEGALQCRVIDSSERNTCFVRAAAGEVLQEAAKEVSAANAPTVTKRLQDTAVDAARVAAKKGSEAGGAPREVMAALTCTVDSSKIEAEGRRIYICRGRL